MENKAYKYYKDGYNCSACLLKAAESYFKIPINKQCYNMCKGVNNGMGIGSTCSVLIASVMVFGLLFDKETTKRLRMILLSEFSKNHKDMGCISLKAERSSSKDCANLIREVALLTKQIIEHERKTN